MKTAKAVAEKHGFINGSSIHSRSDLAEESLYAAMEEYAEHKSNANLIEAALEMLKALQGVVHHNHGLKEIYKVSESLMEQINQAIKKATT